MAARRRKKPLPDGLFPATIEAFSHDGRGVTHVDGKVVFVDGALPGESVQFRYTDVHRDYADGRVVAVIEAAADRVEPLCPHFGVCGGCSLQHLSAEAQIAEKEKLLVDQFRRIGKISEVALWEPLTGPTRGYRHKARLGVKYVLKKGKALVGFREKGSPYLADLDACPVLHPKLGEHLLDLAALIEALSIRERVPQIEAGVGENATALVFRVLDDPSSADLTALREFAERHAVDIYLQRHGPDSIRPMDTNRAHLLSYSLPEQSLTFEFRPTEFTQVNPEINRKMVARVLDVLAPAAPDRVLDLYCGLGNFTLPLARHCGHVVGVEGLDELVTRARQNAVGNGIDNVEFHVADLSKPLASAAWVDSRYDKILLDPSRAGADGVLDYVPNWGAARIVYVSCNPSTLARDAGILVYQHGYRLVRAGVMDMFPHTSHVESIALFEK